MDKITKLNIVILVLLALCAVLWGIALDSSAWVVIHSADGVNYSLRLLHYCSDKTTEEPCLKYSVSNAINDETKALMDVCGKYGVATFILLILALIIVVITFLLLLVTMVCLKSKAALLLKVFIAVLVAAAVAVLAMVTYEVAILRSDAGKVFDAQTDKAAGYVITAIGIVACIIAGILLTIKCCADRRARRTDAQIENAKDKSKPGEGKKGLELQDPPSEDDASDHDPFKQQPAAKGKGTKPATPSDNPFAKPGSRASGAAKSPRGEDNPFASKGGKPSKPDPDNPFATGAHNNKSSDDENPNDNPFARF